LLAGLDLSDRIETEQENDQSEYDCRYAHGFFHHRQNIAQARMPRTTPRNGLETANQKEKPRPESCTIGFIFMISSQEFEDRHFKKNEISCEMLSPSGAAFTFFRGRTS
jgi:hypothetical protein